MPRALVFALMLAVAAACARGQVPRLTGIRAEPIATHANLLPNGGFEELGADGFPAGWAWDRRNTDATCTLDTQVVHGGRRSIRFTSGTPFGAHVYGMLWRLDSVRLQPGKAYTLSAWARSQTASNVGLMTGAGWQFRSYVPATGGQWRRVWVTFTPGEADLDCVARVSVESQTRGVWIDDLKLEEGDAPTPVQAADGTGARLDITPSTPDQVVQGDGPFTVTFILFTPKELDGRAMATVAEAPASAEPASHAAAAGGKGTGGRARPGPHIQGQKSMSVHFESLPLHLAPGAYRIVVSGEARAVDDKPRTVELSVGGAGKVDAVSDAAVRFYSAASALKRAAALRGRLPAWHRRVNALRAQGQDTSYPLVTLTVLDNFTGYAAEDARKGEVRRALEQVGEMEAMAARLDGELAAAARRRLPVVPRWTGRQRPTVHSSSFVGPAAVGRGILQRPIFFNGYGHFGQVVTDLEKWPGYGANFIQIEVGPSRIFPADGKVDEAPVHELLHTLDRAKAAGVAVCLLISPHYMPGWALDKWPQLRKHRDGFLQYCLHAPEGQDLLKRFLGVLIPPIKDHPALHSICLSNEPVNQEEPCEYATTQWHDWLTKRYADPAAMNAAWDTSHAAFTDVPLPNPFGPRPAQPVWMDYLRFNQEFFAGWHRMLADTIHSMAPDLPVHAKAMTWTLTGEGEVVYGVDATLFGSFSQISGNDAVNWYTPGPGEWAQGWLGNAMGHDLQRSTLDAPVCNTENHIVPDRSTAYVAPEHIRAALWQAAAHGQSATAIWVWERAFDPRSDFYGSIMHRPGCAEAVGIVNHDLNRAAAEMTAIQQAPPQVLLLESTTARAWDMGRYGDCLGKLYTALAFAGLKIGFVTERQLEGGIVPTAPVVFVPNVLHLSDAAFAGLRQYTGHIVYVGEGDLLSADDHGHARSERLPGERVPFRYGPTTWRDLWTALLPKLAGWGARPAVELRTSGQPAWGVEWRCASTAAGTVVNMCNYRQAPVTVALRRDGKTPRAVDVLTGARVAGPFTLKPLQVRLLRVPAGR